MTLWKDLQYAVRVLRKNPVFGAVAILSIALGIGANTAIFSLIDAVLLKMLPVKNPEQLLVLGSRSSRTTGYSFTYPTYRRFQEQDQSFSGLAAFSPVRLNVTIDGAREPVAAGQLVSGNYYSVLGVNAIAGRMLSPDDDRVPSGHPVA